MAEIKSCRGSMVHTTLTFEGDLAKKKDEKGDEEGAETDAGDDAEQD
jgi:hypothetical protein